MSRNIDSVVWKHNEHKSLGYARARYAIHQDAAEIAKSNVARAHTWQKFAKKTIIEFLGGEIDLKTKKVKFPDGTSANL